MQINGGINALLSYAEDIHGVNKQLRDLGAEPLVPGTVPVHVLSGGRDVKITYGTEEHSVAVILASLIS